MSESMMDMMSNFFGNKAEEVEESDTIVVGSPDALKKFNAKIAQTYSGTELKEILDCDENMLIVAGAGAGKTTTLLLKIFRDIFSGKLLTTVNANGNTYVKVKDILVSTFLKSGAEDLANKFDEMVKEFKIVGVSSKDIKFRTLHSEVYSALTAMGVKIVIAPAEHLTAYLKESCEYYKVSSVMSKSKILTKEEIGDIECLVAYHRNRLDNDKYNHPLMSEYGLTNITLNAVIERFKMLKALNNEQDFEDLEEMLLDAYPKYPAVMEYVKNRYDYVYIDEFQDTSQLQYALLKPYLDSAEGFIVIGDDDQCIYGWRGSDISLIKERLEEDYKPVVKQLTVNRRCPKNILNSVIPSIEKNSFRHPKKLQSQTDGGSVEIVVDGGIQYLSEILKNDLSKSEKVGILGRTNADLLIPAMVLLLNDYKSFSVSKSVNLKGRIPSMVIGSMQLITQRYNEKFADYFRQFTNKSTSGQANKLAAVLSTNPEYSIYNIPNEDISYSAPALWPLIRRLREEVPKDPVKAYLSLLEMMEIDVYNGKTIYAQRARDFIYYLRKMISEHPKLKDKNIEELSNIFNNVLPNELSHRVYSTKVKKTDNEGNSVEYIPEDKSYVRITTVHDAKGKEWDNVYIWNDVDGCFPNSVGSRDLTDEEFEEERRIHYIAWTRARKKLTVFTRSDRDAGFLGECELDDAKVIQSNENRSMFRTVNSVIRDQKVSEDYNKKSLSDYVNDYITKYSSYEKICTPMGYALDNCLKELGGARGLLDFLKGYSLENIPVEELEGVISDLIEDRWGS